jgi:predicted pyridoxine 5'-phosphate oxidase superfamily flavin-nucleotide-binding protein
MTQLVGRKGQVVIAKEIRDRLGVEPGWSTMQRLVGDHVELYFVPPGHRRSLRGSLSAHVANWPADSDDWVEIRDRAWSIPQPADDSGSL